MQSSLRFWFCGIGLLPGWSFDGSMGILAGMVAVFCARFVQVRAPETAPVNRGASGEVLAGGTSPQCMGVPHGPLGGFLVWLSFIHRKWGI
jgi:hypothetical protein